MQAPAQIGVLLSIATLLAIACARLRVPYTVGLVAAGAALAGWPALTLQLSRELVFALLLPPLVFEAALRLPWPALRRDLWPVVLLASAGVLLAAVLVGAGMHELAGWPVATAMAFGALIAATDPVAVIATFRELRVGGRLALLVEAESLLNDGTAAVLFAAALAVAAGGDSAWRELPLNLLRAVAGGIACGLATGWSAAWLAGRVHDALAAIALSAMAAYGSFHLAESLGCSGILAATAAGLVVGAGSARLPRARRAALESTWDFAAFIANSLIFLLIGHSLARQPLAGLWWPALAAVGLVLAGRALAVYPLCGLLRGGAHAVPRAYQHVLFWGGLRGALALALALGLPASFADREALVAVAFAVVAFSVFVQGLTMAPLLRRLGLLPRDAPVARLSTD